MLSLFLLLACFGSNQTEVERLHSKCNAEPPDAAACFKIGESLLDEGKKGEATTQFEVSCRVETELKLSHRPGCLKEKQLKCDNKEHPACVELANMLAYGEIVEQDVNAASTIVKFSCDAGYQPACNAHERLQSDRKHLVGAQKDRKGCAAGEMSSCSSLGMRHVRQELKEPSLTKAFELFQKSCEANVYAACNQLAWLYMSNNEDSVNAGLPVHDGMAFKYYLKACDGKYGLACANLGQILKNGQGVTPHLKSAIQRFEQACELKNPDGCWYLSKMFQSGDGVQLHEGQATDYRVKACGFGMKSACRSQ